jgi:membrane protein DedA with SNARE-associated domain
VRDHLIAALSLTALTGTAAYLALAGLVSGESAGLPLPGETALIAAAILASRGRLAIEAVIVIAASAAIIGDNLGYVLGRHGGRRLLVRPGPLLEHRHRLLDSGEKFFDKHGAKSVFLARFFTGVRVTGAWMAGINRMHWRTFLLYNALGGICWAALFGLLGYYFGDAAERFLHSAGLVAAIGLGVVIALGVGWLWLRRRRRARAAAAAESARSAIKPADAAPAAEPGG